mmetsp:Transcript_21632/g.60737  ORF Transcript_21632/g.60737 Transcript_21632/m.60737 type:complete len:295 (-) Transcript_21632:89-973(-)
MYKAPTLSIVFIASAIPAHGQFFHSLRATQSYSGSFMSSSSWVAGADGQMHQRVHQVQSETVSDGFLTKHTQSEVSCAHGSCQQQTLRATHPSHPGAAAAHQMPVPASIRGILGRMFAPAYPGALALPQLRGYIHHIQAPTSEPRFVTVVAQPAAAPPVTAAAPLAQGAGGVEAFIATSALAALLGCTGLAAFVVAASGWYRSHGGGAREQPLAALGVPLAPSQEAVGSNVPAPEPKTTPVAPGAKCEDLACARLAARALLPKLYERALSAPEGDAEGALTAYMVRVYARAAAA